MRCNPLRWLWGLIPVAMLALLANHWERAGIEADLSERARQAFAKIGLDWPAVAFEGREAALTGRALDESEPRKAVDALRGVWGVRTVKANTDLVEKVAKYTWAAERAGKTIKLTGLVPSEATRKTLTGMVKAAFPKGDIEDTMKIARGAPGNDVWLGGLGFAVKHLASLKSGTVSLGEGKLSIAGEAVDQGSYKALKTALGSLPAGFSLGKDGIVAPAVSPFKWAAKLAGNQLVLSGHVPSDAVREDLFQRAKSSFPRIAVVDRTEIASGAPEAFAAAAAAGLEQLYQLTEGSADIKDGTLTLTGVADDEPTAETVRKALKKSAPGAFKVAEQVTFLKPRLARVDVYTTDIAVAGDAIDVTGYAPSEEARKALADAVRAAFPGREVRDRLELGEGASQAWQTCLAAGAQSLAKLGNGRVTLTGGDLELTGKTTDAGLQRSLPDGLAAAAGKGCTVSGSIGLEEVRDPNLWWRGEFANNVLVLEGEAPDAASRSALAADAVGIFPGAKIEDRMTVVSKRSQGWPTVTRDSLKILSKLRSGTASLFLDDVAITGEAGSEDSAASVRTALKTLPRGYIGRDMIIVRTDAATAAAEAAERAKAEEEARQAAAEARRKAEEDAKRAAAEAEARKTAEAEAAAKAQAEAEARAKAEADTAAKAKAEAEARAKAEAEAAARKAAADAAANRCQKLVSDAAAAGTILFQWASDKLDAKSAPTLDKLAKIVAECPGTRVEIQGHTSADGDPTRNQNLSERRAKSVADYLVSKGVDAGRLAAVGYGFSRPIAANDSEANRAKNRRIEFSVKAE